MNVKELFSGVAIAIDDEVKNPKTSIGKILRQIEKEGIPLVQYEELPAENTIPHFKNLSFIVLDWNFKRAVPKDQLVEGVKLPDTLTDDGVQENIDFIKKVMESVFCPIFIFTNENVGDIKKKLIEENICIKNKPNNIFVKPKTKLKDSSKVFSEIGKWLKKNPSIYVLKEWEREYQNSRGKLFSDFQKMSPIWPKIMWDNFKTDGDNQSYALGELISRNLHTRMRPFEFENSLLGGTSRPSNQKELRSVLEGERYLANAGLHTDDIATGDIFRKDETQSGKTIPTYYLNIRPQCDLLRGNKADKTDLYFLKGTCLEESTVNKKKGVAFISGGFIEKVSHAIVPFLDSGCVIEFKLKNLLIVKWGDYKAHRIGRLLPPHINRIQQKYSFYLQRQALPSTPASALFERKKKKAVAA